MTIVKRDNDKDIKFTGNLIAEISSKKPVDDIRWTELQLYRTQGGKFICSEIGRTTIEGEHNHHKADVCEDHDEVINFFGYGWFYAFS